MAKKFKLFAESYITRYTNGGFLAQDVVKLIKSYKSDKQFKKLAKDLQKTIENLFAMDTNVRVIEVISNKPDGAGNDVSSRGTDFSCVLSPEIMPGRTDNNLLVTVPCSVLEVETAYPNLPKIPKKFMYEFEEIIKPVPYEPKDSTVEPSDKEVKPNKKDRRSNLDQTKMTQQGKSLKKSDTELKNKNIKIAKESLSQTGDMLMESYLNELSM